VILQVVNSEDCVIYMWPTPVTSLHVPGRARSNDLAEKLTSWLHNYTQSPCKLTAKNTL